MARKRETWQQRKAREVAKYGATPGVRRAQRERGRGEERKYQAERDRREALAHQRGFASAAEATRFRRETGIRPGEETRAAANEWRRDKTLARFGLTKAKFDRMRAANRRWSYGTPAQQSFLESTSNQGKRADAILNGSGDKIEYRLEVDSATDDWSEDRIGYVVAFYNANVNPRTNYDQLTDKGRHLYDPKGNRKTNRAQYDYLVTFGQFMSVTEFEQRYGIIPAA